jgi:hypothetical protein
MKAAKEWLDDIDRRVPGDSQREALLRAGPDHVRRLIGVNEGMNSELNRLWGVTGDRSEAFDVDDDPTIDLVGDTEDLPTPSSADEEELRK